MSPTFAVYVKFIACLISDPGVCHEQQMRFQAEHNLTPQQCVINAMPELAKWIEEHPKFRITQFACITKPEIDA